MIVYTLNAITDQNIHSIHYNKTHYKKTQENTM